MGGALGQSHPCYICNCGGGGNKGTLYIVTERKDTYDIIYV